MSTGRRLTSGPRSCGASAEGSLCPGSRRRTGGAPASASHRKLLPALVRSLPPSGPPSAAGVVFVSCCSAHEILMRERLAGGGAPPPASSSAPLAPPPAAAASRPPLAPSPWGSGPASSGSSPPPPRHKGASPASRNPACGAAMATLARLDSARGARLERCARPRAWGAQVLQPRVIRGPRTLVLEHQVYHPRGLRVYFSINPARWTRAYGGVRLRTPAWGFMPLCMPQHRLA